MRVLTGEEVLVRIFIGDSDTWHHQSLHVALVERLRREGFAGATVFHEFSGFGARSVLHTTNILRLSEDLPIVVEVVDTEEHIERLTHLLDEMVTEGLVTMERVRVSKYTSRTRPQAPRG